MACFAVIDTETNWFDQVMSIGTVIADAQTFRVLDARYHILPAYCEAGGLYADALFLETPVEPVCCTRKAALRDLDAWFRLHGVTDIYAYNARFDKNHLPELSAMQWHDIMSLAVYRRHNPRIPAHWETYSTGRLKRGYGVEPMLRLLSGNGCYRETHNAILDALDELEIMRLLGHGPRCYSSV